MEVRRGDDGGGVGRGEAGVVLEGMMVWVSEEGSGCSVGGDDGLGVIRGDDGVGVGLGREVAGVMLEGKWVFCWRG